MRFCFLSVKSAMKKPFLYSLAALGLFTAQNYNLEPLAYKLRRDLAGIPVVCSPWTVAPDDDFDECMAHQRELDVAGGLAN